MKHDRAGRTAGDRVISDRSCSVEASNEETLSRLLGPRDENLRLIEERYPVRLAVKDLLVSVQGPDTEVVDLVSELIRQLMGIARKGHVLRPAEVTYAMNVFAEEGVIDLLPMYEDVICLTYRGKPVRPKTGGQKRYVDAIRRNDVLFAVGPAGTGKTYLAVALAVAALKEGKVNRVVLVRPAVEAGESLGYLPGDLKEKVEPYLRPLYDAFYEMFSPERFMKYVEKKVIEIAPLAYMRGRTLNDSFIILDEAQNTTPEQMKMFLTRLGFGSKAVVIGDITQIDLPSGKDSGLKVVRNILKRIPGVEFVSLDKNDVVRHEVVQRIVQAYEEYEQKRQ
ncbi:MAG: PhoH family protein [Thermovirgaceae bacterium]|jgi:phosphate starvation-inducible PhoH-like protein|nr:PhoH family protein [Synergistales bacterium]MDI9392869.1 PhoH family protein [Synergistota bacterium]MDY0179252.1 PhoH family protein [Synergistaceae bacterium]HRW87393.1 PhoH family protein [Thermovirgaceae bacterium]MDD3829762.1 PhoH family protein [Synergistales bacterium]